MILSRFCFLQVFESDIFNRQQILFAIITDGQRMVQDGDLDDPEEFQLQLDQLSEQWQSVIRRTAAKKDDIDRNIRSVSLCHAATALGSFL